MSGVDIAQKSTHLDSKSSAVPSVSGTIHKGGPRTAVRSRQFGTPCQGRIQDFLKGGSESGVDIEGGANCSIVSLKQGVWRAQPPRSYGVFNFG